MPNRPTRIQPDWRLVALILLILLLAACAPLQTASVVPLSTAEAFNTPSDAFEPLQDDAIDTEQLASLVLEGLPVRTGNSSEGFDGVTVIPVETTSTASLWAIHTYGIRPFNPPINHFVALYRYDEAWTEVTRFDLECPDYVDSAGIAQVAITPDSVWLSIEGGAGAHSGCFALLRWDGDEFTVAAEGFNSSPGAGTVADVDNDGQLEVLLNGTDPYVFCYACGVRLYATQLLRWDDNQLVTVALSELPGSAPGDIQELNNRAVAFANASLYPSALTLIQNALTQAPDNEIVYWNAQLIKLYAENRLGYAVSGAYPLLGYVFYGDYAAAVEQMRGLSPAEIFSLESPLVANTAANGWVEELSHYLISYTNAALAVQPDLAEAYFLRGWGRFLADPYDLDAVIDVNRAALLAPFDPLIVESERYLQGISPRPLPTPTAGSAMIEPSTATPLRMALGATTMLVRADLQTHGEQHYLLEVEGGQSVYVTAPPGINTELFAPTGLKLSVERANGADQFLIPTSGVYRLAVRGEQMVDLLIYIPPVHPYPNAPVAENFERIRFAAGATGTTAETNLTEGTVQGFVLGISAGQNLFVFLSGNGTYTVLDPQGRLLTPISVDPTGSAQYTIPYSGDYGIVLHGSGQVTLTAEIPPR